MVKLVGLKLVTLTVSLVMSCPEAQAALSCALAITPKRSPVVRGGILSKPLPADSKNQRLSAVGVALGDDAVMQFRRTVERVGAESIMDEVHIYERSLKVSNAFAEVLKDLRWTPGDYREVFRAGSVSTPKQLDIDRLLGKIVIGARLFNGRYQFFGGMVEQAEALTDDDGKVHGIAKLLTENGEVIPTTLLHFAGWDSRDNYCPEGFLVLDYSENEKRELSDHDAQQPIKERALVNYLPSPKLEQYGHGGHYLRTWNQLSIPMLETVLNGPSWQPLSLEDLLRMPPPLRYEYIVLAIIERSGKADGGLESTGGYLGGVSEQSKNDSRPVVFFELIGDKNHQGARSALLSEIKLLYIHEADLNLLKRERRLSMARKSI